MRKRYVQNVDVGALEQARQIDRAPGFEPQLSRPMLGRDLPARGCAGEQIACGLDLPPRPCGETAIIQQPPEEGMGVQEHQSGSSSPSPSQPLSSSSGNGSKKPSSRISPLSRP